MEAPRAGANLSRGTWTTTTWGGSRQFTALPTLGATGSCFATPQVAEKLASSIPSIRYITVKLPEEIMLSITSSPISLLLGSQMSKTLLCNTKLCISLILIVVVSSAATLCLRLSALAHALNKSMNRTTSLPRGKSDQEYSTCTCASKASSPSTLDTNSCSRISSTPRVKFPQLLLPK